MTMMMRRAGSVVGGNLQAARGGLRAPTGMIALLLMLLLLAGTSIAQFAGPALEPAPAKQALVPTTDPAILFPASREVQLGPGDLIAVHLYGVADYLPTVRVAMDGTIELPLVGLVAAEGLSVHQAQDLIAKRLRDAGMYRNPQVSLQVMESPNESVTVTGEMHGVFPVAGGKRLYDVLALAGGLPVTASHTVVINRPGIADPIVIDLGTNPGTSNYANVPVFPGDTIVTSRVGVVYVLGAFKTQGAVPLNQNAPYTLMQLAAQSAGPGFEGTYSDLRLIRTSGDTRTVVKVDLKKVMDGKAPDPVLQANDIVFLPTSPMKGAIKYGGIGTVLGIISLLLYAATI
jgi:polysaccharide export outer membrane protein